MKANFQWIGGATFILSIGGLKIAVDPVLCPKGEVQDYFWFKSKRNEAPVFAKNAFEDIDLWLITHNQEAHLDALGLVQISQESQVVSNKNASFKLVTCGIKSLKTLDWKAKQVYHLKNYTIQIEAIPAIHGVNPLSAFLLGK